MSLKNILLFSICSATAYSVRCMEKPHEPVDTLMEYPAVQYSSKDGKPLMREIYSNLLQKKVNVPESIIQEIIELDRYLMGEQTRIKKEKSINYKQIKFYNQIAKMRENIIARCNNTPLAKL